MEKQRAGCENIGASKAGIILRLIILALNLLALAGGIVYAVHPTPYLFWNLYGFVIFLALLGGIALAGFGGMHRHLDYCYLLLNTISMLLIPIMNTLASSDVQNKASQNIFVVILYNAIFLFGAVSACLRIKNDLFNRKSGPEREIQAQSDSSGNARRWIAVILLCPFLLFGIFLSYILLGHSTGNMIEVFISEYAIFWGFLVLSASILIIRLRWRKKGPVFNKIVLALGIMIYAICMVPFASIPLTIRDAEVAFQEAFGNTINDQHGFMKSPFSLQNYFFGTRTHDYIVRENVLYYEGVTGVDTGIRLHFDAYMPTDGGNLQSRNPVLIRIHGGAWVLGDKGFSNYSETNKHFVNLGYVVFDIQYGLNDRNTSYMPSASSRAPTSVKGNFDIDDMVRHIGIFTAYLADHAGEYGADLNSVFISGASAGGQLAIASALGITGGKYTDLLDSRLRVRGLIPFYPANSLSPSLGIGGTPDLVDPAALVGEDSPPCLIYHGTHDGIVNPKYASIFQKAYEDRSSAPCALLWMNFASHGSDFYTPGYYNQIFMYYMERFMYQYR
ncbi:MAG: alpha/beta hydrolase [Treponema sp.]|jgi:acetyl esterase/lipase|nr:alpha/beta hydrolase [Treponema sp.]